MVSAAGASSPASATAKFTEPVRLFYSYSHQDEELRKELENHLSLLRGKANLWLARPMIGAGDEWKGQSTRTWRKPSSSSCWSVHRSWLPITAGTLRRNGQSSATTEARRRLSRSFFDRATGRALRSPGSRDSRLTFWPVTTWTNKDEAFKNIAQGIRRAIEGMRNGTR